jgi:glutaredoxin
VSGFSRTTPLGIERMIALTIYTRPGCHLCDDMKAAIKRVAQASPEPVMLEEIDISSDPELERRYGEEIPVLLLGNRKIAKYRIADRDLTRILNREAAS